MSFAWIRTAAATASVSVVALVTLIATGCDPVGNTVGTTAGEHKPPMTSPATARQSTPAATPSSATSPSATSLENLPVLTIMQQTRKASLAATSLRMRGTFDDAGDLTTFDIALGDGGGEGTFSIEGASYSVRVVGRTIYLRLSESAIRAQAKDDKSSAAETAQILKLLKNKWIKLSKVDKDTREMVDLVAPGGFFKTVFAEDDTAGAAAPKKLAARTVDGVRCVGITDSGATMWIDTTTGRLIRMTDGKNRFSFSAYGKTPAPKAPAKSQVLDGKAMGL
jgi:hypothetical protein